MRHWAEDLARDYLLGLGYELLEENYVVRGGEIDLVVRDGRTIVFVEVRQRRTVEYGTAGESLDRRKLEKVRRAARIFLAARCGAEDPSVRFDAVLVHGTLTSNRIEHIPGID